MPPVPVPPVPVPLCPFPWARSPGPVPLGPFPWARSPGPVPPVSVPLYPSPATRLYILVLVSWKETQRTTEPICWLDFRLHGQMLYTTLRAQRKYCNGAMLEKFTQHPSIRICLSTLRGYYRNYCHLHPPMAKSVFAR